MKIIGVATQNARSFEGKREKTDLDRDSDSILPRLVPNLDDHRLLLSLQLLPKVDSIVTSRTALPLGRERVASLEDTESDRLESGWDLLRRSLLVARTTRVQVPEVWPPHGPAARRGAQREGVGGRRERTRVEIPESSVARQPASASLEIRSRAWEQRGKAHTCPPRYFRIRLLSASPSRACLATSPAFLVSSLLFVHSVKR